MGPACRGVFMLRCGATFDEKRPPLTTAGFRGFRRGSPVGPPKPVHDKPLKASRTAGIRLLSPLWMVAIVTHRSVPGHRGCLALTLGPRRGPISIAPGGGQASATRGNSRRKDPTLKGSNPNGNRHRDGSTLSGFLQARSLHHKPGYRCFQLWCGHPACTQM